MATENMNLQDLFLATSGVSASLPTGFTRDLSLCTLQKLAGDFLIFFGTLGRQMRREFWGFWGAQKTEPRKCLEMLGAFFVRDFVTQKQVWGSTLFCRSAAIRFWPRQSYPQNTFRLLCCPTFAGFRWGFSWRILLATVPRKEEVRIRWQAAWTTPAVQTEDQRIIHPESVQMALECRTM